MKIPGYLISIMLLVVILTACATPKQSSPTNAPTQTVISAKSMIRPGDKIGEMTIASESIFSHKWLIEFCEFDVESIVPTQTTDCTVTNQDTLALGMGLSVAADKFAANWEAKTWELEIDGYPVALEDFGWEDMPYQDESGAGITRGWSVVLKNLTTGLHTIRWSSSAEITTEDWANEYPPGKYEFIINLTVAEKAYPTISASTLALEKIKPGDKIGEMTIEREAGMHYYRLMDVFEFNWTIMEPHSETVESTLPQLSAVGVNIGWAAYKTKIESNWEAMSWEIYIDDHPLALDQFGWDDINYFSDPTTEVTLRTWNIVVKNLSSGKHTFRYSISQEVSVDNGWDIYPPGKYEYIAYLTVTEKPVYPTVSSVANPGQHAYTSQKANLDFLLYLPEAYGTDPGTKWPLIIYLHDAEWRGTSPEILRGEFNPEYMITSLPKELEIGKDLPFIVLSPVGNGGWQFWSTDEMITPLFTLLEEIQSFYSVDAKRIYLTGEGMGGNGVWAIGLRYPEYFAALAPFDGYLNYPFEVPENICDLKEDPIWAFHGGNDFMVPVEVEQELVDAVNACGGNAQITVKPYAVIPGEIYAESELYEWFLSQTRK